jgi:hypothetical protein
MYQRVTWRVGRSARALSDWRAKYSAALSAAAAGTSPRCRPRPWCRDAERALACYICVVPPIQCIEPSEWDDACESGCGPHAYALSCPYQDEPTCQTTWSRVDCHEG